MKLGQILVCYITNISNMFLAQCWRLLVPGLFMTLLVILIVDICKVHILSRSTNLASRNHLTL